MRNQNVATFLEHLGRLLLEGVQENQGRLLEKDALAELAESIGGWELDRASRYRLRPYVLTGAHECCGFFVQDTEELDNPEVGWYVYWEPTKEIVVSITS